MRVFENHNGNNIESTIPRTGKLGIEFIEIISNDEVNNCKKSFTELIFSEDSNSQPLAVVELDYDAFRNIIISEESQFCKFYLLPSNVKFMTFGLTFSDSEDLKQIADKFYLLVGNQFIEQNIAINEIRGSNEFLEFKSTIENTTNNINCSEMILYERKVILDYLDFMETLKELTESEIDHLEFHNIYFKDFERKDGAMLDYMQPKENRMSFAVKTVFSVNEKTNRNLKDLLDAYYDAGDLKP